jgi:hypothetical protein
VHRFVLGSALVGALVSSCLGTIVSADSHPTQVESGLTPVTYGDTVVGEAEPRDGGREGRGERP